MTYLQINTYTCVAFYIMMTCANEVKPNLTFRIEATGIFKSSMFIEVVLSTYIDFGYLIIYTMSMYKDCIIILHCKCCNQSKPTHMLALSTKHFPFETINSTIKMVTSVFINNKNVFFSSQCVFDNLLVKIQLN